MFSPRQHLKMSQMLRRRASLSHNPGPLLRESAKFLSLAKIAVAKRLRLGGGQTGSPAIDITCQQVCQVLQPFRAT
jgi:hypothetical protein